MRRLLLPALIWGGCRFRSADPNRGAEAEPGGPCWAVDLSDGVDGTGELHDLYACLDRTGALAPLAGLDAALDADTPAGRPAGDAVADALAAAVPHLPPAPDLLDGLLALDDGGALGLGLEVAVEAIHGVPYDDVDDATGVGDGPLAPLLGEVPALAEAAARTGAAAAAGALLASEEAGRAACSAVGLARSEDADVAALGAALLADGAAAVARARSPGDDLWSGASGDSLRDAARALLVDLDGDGEALLDALEPTLAGALGDPLLLQRVRAALGTLRDEGRLAPLPLQLRHLASVDPAGGALEPGEDSALLAFLRLLARADAPLDCSLDLWVTGLEVHVDNLSVEILRALAGMETGTVQDGVDVLGTVLGWPISSAVLDAVADSGVCPLVDRQLVDDLAAIDRLGDPEVGDLLVALLALLDAFEDAEDDRLPEMVELLAEPWRQGAVPPLEEAFRDLGDSAFAGDLVDLLVLLLDPAPLETDACPDGPADLEDAWTLADRLLAGDEGGALRPVLASAVEEDATWTALGAAAGLLADPRARSHQAWELLARLSEQGLGIREAAAELLSDDALVGPALEVARAGAPAEALAAVDADGDGPLPFFSRLVRRGTFAGLVRTVRIALAALGAGGEEEG